MWNNKGAKMLSEHFYDDRDSELIIQNNGKEYRITEMYEDISLRLDVLSEIINEMVEMYPDQREKLDIEKRVEQKLMLRKLSGDV
jgi:hypothetical protein